MTGRDDSVVSQTTRKPAWLVATVLAVAVMAVVFSLPYFVHWLWPGLDNGLLMVGNLFLGGLLGVTAVLVFLHWKWEL